MRSKSQARVPGAVVGAQARRLRALLVELSRRRPVRDPVAAACEDLGLTPAQIHIVAWLGQDGPLTMGALARRVAVTEKTITGVVDRLERDDLVQRTRDPGDRRVVQVRLAGRGEELFRRIDAEIEAKLVALLGWLEPGDRQHLVGMLEKLAARLALRQAQGERKIRESGTSRRRPARPEEA